MSSIEVVVSPDAQRDWYQILHYTLEKWGEGQRDIYDEVIWSALRRIQWSPKIGRVSFTDPDERELVLEHHTIRYQYVPEENAALVLRIISNRRRRSR